MIDFLTSQGTNITGTFPSVAAKNVSGAGATDGTALLANWLNNLWGAFQDTLQRAGLTPSGVAEAYAAETGTLPLGTTATQWRTAMQMAFGSPGELVLWCRSQAPATVGARILLLQGQTLTIANYKDLVAATYCGDAANNTANVPFYKSSDNGGVTRATSGTYFTLPDARGVTIRGVDTGNTRDWGGSTRGGGTPNGSIQGFAVQGHYHNPLSGVGPYFAIRVASGGTDLATGGGSTINNETTTGLAITDGLTYEGKVNPAIQLASETRMINMACYIGIRY